MTSDEIDASVRAIVLAIAGNDEEAAMREGFKLLGNVLKNLNTIACALARSQLPLGDPNR